MPGRKQTKAGSGAGARPSWSVRVAIIAGILATAGPPLPAWAENRPPPEPGRSYRVTGIASDDRLNVREAPAAEAAKKSALPPDAADIIVSGAVAEGSGSDWWEVIVPGTTGGTGWVNSRYLAPADEDKPSEPSFALRCIGTEPFWSTTFLTGEARYSTPDGDDSWTAGGWLPTANRTDRFAIRIEDEGGRTGHAAISREICSDGMSDIRYPFEVLLVAPDGAVLSGCCARAAE